MERQSPSALLVLDFAENPVGSAASRFVEQVKDDLAVGSFRDSLRLLPADSRERNAQVSEKMLVVRSQRSLVDARRRIAVAQAKNLPNAFGPTFRPTARGQPGSCINLRPEPRAGRLPRQEQEECRWPSGRLGKVGRGSSTRQIAESKPATDANGHRVAVPRDGARSQWRRHVLGQYSIRAPAARGAQGGQRCRRSSHGAGPSAGGIRQEKSASGGPETDAGSRMLRPAQWEYCTFKGACPGIRILNHRRRPEGLRPFRTRSEGGFMARDQNTFAKRQRKMQERQKAADKRAKRQRKKVHTPP